MCILSALSQLPKQEDRTRVDEIQEAANTGEEDNQNKSEAEAQAARDADTLNRLSQREKHFPSANWLEGILPLHIIADGFASSSASIGWAKHWLYALMPQLHEVYPCLPCVGFSYSLTPGRNYPPLRTRISFAASPHLVNPYLPKEYMNVTYHAFSLAGPIFLLGLSDWLRNVPISSFTSPTPAASETSDATADAPTETQSASEATPDYSQTLILVQPAFLLPESIIYAVDSMNNAPGAIATLATSSRKFWGLPHDPGDHSADFLDRIESAIRLITSRIKVKMLYWPGDEFITYDTNLINRLTIAGIEPQRVDLAFSASSAKRPFHRHCLVAHQPEMLEAIMISVANSAV